MCVYIATTHFLIETKIGTLYHKHELSLFAEFWHSITYWSGETQYLSSAPFPEGTQMFRDSASSWSKFIMKNAYSFWWALPLVMILVSVHSWEHAENIDSHMPLVKQTGSPFTNYIKKTPQQMYKNPQYLLKDVWGNILIWMCLL